MISGLITKKVFLESIACPTRAWFAAREESETLSTYDRFIIEEGLEIHNRAHQLFPEGVLIDGGNSVAAGRTAQLLNKPDVSTLFEATFIIRSGVTRADILKKIPSGLHLLEVKSGLEPKSKYIEDLSYTTMICKQAGLPIKSCSLLLLSRDYRYGMPVQALFQEHDCTEQVLKRADEFWELFDQQANLVFSDTKPKSEFKLECKGCDYFESCFKNFPKYSIFDLPRLSHTKFCQLRDMETTRIEDIPGDFALTESQKKIRKAVLSGKPFVSKSELKRKLKELEYPLFFLDFETVTTALPIYPETTPHIQIPTQYSLHIVSRGSEMVRHYEYLADPKKDCRRQLSENLICQCENSGNVLTYSDFERSIIKKMVALFPDLSKELGALLSRLVDMCQLIQQCYYHPDFHGSFSIKNVLPVMVPDLGYANMEIANGSDAIAHFAYMARGKYTHEEEDQIRQNLLAYCKLDTLAMVKLYQQLKMML